MKKLQTNKLFKHTEDRLHQIKEAFEENQELINLVFERMPIGICITDEEGDFVNVNKSYTEIYGYSKAELIGKPFTCVVPEEGKKEMQKLHDAFMNREEELTGNWEVINKDNEVFNVLMNAAYIEEPDSNTSFKMTFVVKLDDANDAHEKLEGTVKVLEHKIEAQESAMSLTEHDIRKNISTMVTIADIMMKMDRSEKDKKWLKMIKTSGYDTLDLLQATEDYILMESGNYDPELEDFDIITLLEKIKFDSKDFIRSKNCQFSIKLTGSSKTNSLIIKADLFYFTRMLKNLITNAIEACPENSVIQLKLHANENFEIDIHNEGVIPEEIRNEFFEKYITSGKSTGTGLGTYIAQLIANVHEGNITFDTSEKNGTSLRIQLPKNTVQKQDVVEKDVKQSKYA
jgi:PAS domain S-box-containing protein